VSFRAKLTLMTAMAIAVTVAAASFAVWVLAKHQLQSQVDRSLKVQAQQALSTDSHGPGRIGAIAYTQLAPDGDVVGGTTDVIPITDSITPPGAGRVP